MYQPLRGFTLVTVLVLIAVVVLVTSVWVYFDAKTQAYKQSPLTWAALCLLVWVVFFPWYVATRTQPE